jgi:DNA recombination protein RmuC
MMVAAYVVLGIIVGGIAVWIIASSKLKGFYEIKIAGIEMDHAKQRTEVEGRAKSAEAVNTELRRQVADKEDAITQMRKELTSERQMKVEASTRLAESQRNLEEQKALIEEMENELKKTFKALSLDALKENSGEFLKLAAGTLKSQTVEGSKELDGKKQLIDRSLETMTKTLADVQKKIEDVGKGNIEVSTLIKKHEEVTFKLKDTADHLRHALASSKKRGEWGERIAEDIIRLVGMVEGISYVRQKTLEHAAGRPDYTFLLPNSLKINMDVKFPMENYQHYLDAQSEHDRKRFRDELLKNARIMLKQVTTRDYINPAENTVDYVMMFIPNEQVYSFLNEADTTLMDEALRQKVILCSPFTLYAVLAVVRQAVENFNLERTASEILKQLSEFSKQWAAYKDKFRAMGERLDAAKKEYDAIVTTRTNMLERPLRKIDDLQRQKSIALDEDIRPDGSLPL